MSVPGNFATNSPRPAAAKCVAGIAANAAMYMFLLLLGIFQFTHYPHFSDFMGDVTYPDLAHSILEHGTYQIRLLSETTLPPGLPLLLAFAGMLFGLTPRVEFGVVAFSSALGLIASYELLRRVESRYLAIPAILLLASAPTLFGFNTAVIFPEMPYFLASMLALLLIRLIDRTESRRALPWLVGLLCILLGLAILIRSVGIALAFGLAAWISVSFFVDRPAGMRRAIRFLLPVVVALAVQLIWSTWAQRHQTFEWQLPGYPHSYLSQLRVKDGRHPELGLAQLSDIPTRVERNVFRRARGLTVLLLRRRVAPFWPSPAIAGTVLLIAMGLISSLRAGGEAYDWYFLFYEIIFMLWPWNYNDRFLAPVVPLACLYLWRGVRLLLIAWQRYPRRALVGFVLVGGGLAISAAAFALGLIHFPIDPDHRRGDHLQTVIATIFWLAVAAGPLIVLRFGKVSQDPPKASPHIYLRRLSFGFLFLALVAVGATFVSGLRMVVATGQRNLHPQLTQESLYPDFDAALWVREHELLNTVVLAGEPEFVFHYSHRPTVWFPPISDPHTLMVGIVRHHVKEIIVVHRSSSYWLPPEDICAANLLRTYGAFFRLAHQGADYQVYDVLDSAYVTRL